MNTDSQKKTLTFDNVSKTYGDITALNKLSFSIAEGELYGLIGPNGAGKTTSIRLLLGLERPSEGRIEILGHSPSNRAHYSEIGYMPQETSLYIELTVEENLELFGRLYGLDRSALKNKISELLAFVELTERRKTVVANLSGGMKHRASLAVALLPEPKLLILDEPTVGVDPELRQGFWSRFAEMQKKGITILITTHYMDEAAHCHRVGLISSGHLIAQGTPNALLKESQAKNLEEAFLKLIKREAIK